jgi:hypothetical protein
MGLLNRSRLWEGSVLRGAVRHHSSNRRKSCDARLILAVLSSLQVEALARAIHGIHRCLAAQR